MLLYTYAWQLSNLRKSLNTENVNYAYILYTNNRNRSRWDRTEKQTCYVQGSLTMPFTKATTQTEKSGTCKSFSDQKNVRCIWRGAYKKKRNSAVQRRLQTTTYCQKRLPKEALPANATRNTHKPAYIQLKTPLITNRSISTRHHRITAYAKFQLETNGVVSRQRCLFLPKHLTNRSCTDGKQAGRLFVNTSAKKVMFHPAFVCLSVCLSVCLLANSRKTTDRVFMKILPETYLWTKNSHYSLEVIGIRSPDLNPDSG